MFKRLQTRLRDFFFPPAGAPRWARVLPYAFLGALTLMLLIGAAYGWEYTNSPAFCGESCHTMPPEYTSYLISPHARIDCVDCHIGKGFIATRITRKAGDLKHVYATLFQDYEFPIRAHELRPARETCELCHSPEKFSDDSLREIKRFAKDRANTPLSIYLVLKTGGGSQREGLGRGIHWHIENRVYYFAADPEEQEIPYVRVENPDGTTSEYLSVDSDLDPAAIDPAELKEVDCITCHNRITHLVPAPDDTVDQMMRRGLISAEIPDIRAKAVEVYSQIYET
ncbi:MAG: NapC/NirT family cytochrome c, partial [Chloroflexi bacterium]|nr:NapC/NirT family cytochrome c [Chloroflexota bacterium]